MEENRIDEMEKSHRRDINRMILFSWGVIVLVLHLAYIIEVFKGQRTLAYMGVFCAVVLIPFIFCIIRYKRMKDDALFPHFVICGYFIMYAFVLFTGSTTMVFSYILPMLCFLVLFHKPGVIMGTAIASIIVNIISIIVRYKDHLITVDNSKDVEIQMALIILCFAGAWVSSRMYNRIMADHRNLLIREIHHQDTIKNLQNDVNIDKMTDLGSRAAYEEALEQNTQTDKVGVIFCDVNSLKYMNDNLGHKAGDELLCRVAEILKVHFRKTDCFRISGDEFVVIMPNLDKEVFEVRAARFHDAVWSVEVPLASVGWDYNTDVMEAIKNAEVRMYTDKNLFYEKYPKYKR